MMKNRLTLWFLAQQQPLRVRSCSERAEDGVQLSHSETFPSIITSRISLQS